MRVVLNSFPLWLGIACLTMGGCTDRRRADVAHTKKTYVEFRAALLEENFDKATNSLSSDLLMRYPNYREMLTNYFRTLRSSDMELTTRAWVKFDGNKSNAFLFPRQPPTVGYGFVRESNVWKITVNVIPYLDFAE